jgi:hypothetical protein
VIYDAYGRPVGGQGSTSTPLQGMQGELASQIKLAIRQLMVEAVTDQLLHAEVVAAGPFEFRRVFNKDMGAMFGNSRGECDNLADLVYRFCEVQWRQKYLEYTATQFLNNVRIKTGPTAQEIEDAWEVEIGSSDVAMRTFYEGSCRTRKGRDLGERKARVR